MSRRSRSLAWCALMAGAIPTTALAVPDPNRGALLAEGPAGGSPELDARLQAAPQAKTLAILILSGDEAGLALSETYSEARKVIEAHTAISVAPLDQIGVTDRETAIRSCAGKADCYVQRLSNTLAGISLLLTISVDRLEDGMLLGLRLVDVASKQEIGASGDEVPAGMSVSGAMEQQLATVFPGSTWDQIAEVSVTTEPPNAEVSVGGRSCASPCTLNRMVPGTYEVSINKEGYLPWKGNVTLVAKQNQAVSAVLQEPPAGLVSSPLFWGLVAAAAVGTGVAIFFLAQPSERVVRICIAEDPANCP